jgi:Secretory lipase
MRRFTLLLPAVLLAWIPVAHAASVPEPEDDPFYDVPANVASYVPGDVIDARPITALVYALPVPADTWQVLYRTSGAHGVPTATVTTLMIPKTAWTGRGPRPLVSYQTAEDGVAGRCAPSYGLRAGPLGSGLSNASTETGLMFSALANNWAVTVPDCEGPDSQFLAGLMEGQAILDGIRASVRLREAGLPAHTPVGIWGYSGGAFATSIAGQLEAAYAPEIKLQGIALGGVVAEIRKTIDAFSGSPVGGAIAMGINGPIKVFPEYDLAQYLSASGKAKVAAAARDCITDAVARYPFLRTSDLEAFPGVLLFFSQRFAGKAP